jgi:hypothetical protein
MALGLGDVSRDVDAADMVETEADRHKLCAGNAIEIFKLAGMGR